MIHPIHQTPEERQAFATQETTRAVYNTRATLDKIVENTDPSRVANSLLQMLKGDLKGDKGDKGDTPSKEEVLALIKPLIPAPIKGKDGKSVIEGQVIKKILERIPLPADGKQGAQGEKGEDGSPDTGEQIVEKLNPLKNVLDFQVLRNIPDFVQVKDIPGGGGGGQYLTFRDSTGARISAQVTDIQFGAGISASYASGKITITTTASTAVLTATGTIDDSNKDFTFTQKPSVIVMNGATYQQTGGAITWTWTAGTLTATLSSPVGSGGSLFGIA